MPRLLHYWHYQRPIAYLQVTRLPTQPLTSEPALQPVRSPCTGICKLVEQICIGCGRSLAQISAWRSMNIAEQQAVIAQLADQTEEAQ